MSQFSFKNVGHFFATMAGDIVKGARAVANVMVKVEKAEPEIEAISALFFPEPWNWNGAPLPCWGSRRRP